MDKRTRYLILFGLVFIIALIGADPFQKKFDELKKIGEVREINDISKYVPLFIFEPPRYTFFGIELKEEEYELCFIDEGSYIQSDTYENISLDWTVDFNSEQNITVPSNDRACITIPTNKTFTFQWIAKTNLSVIILKDKENQKPSKSLKFEEVGMPVQIVLGTYQYQFNVEMYAGPSFKSAATRVLILIVALWSFSLLFISIYKKAENGFFK